MYFMGFYGAVDIKTVIEVRYMGVGRGYLLFRYLPFYFLTFFPILPPSYSLSPMYPSPSPQTMSHAAYVHDIQHVIVDNLQFMLGSNYQVHDRYTVQNQAIAEFRKFASAKNIHVSVVIHPRKVRYLWVWRKRGVEEEGCGEGVWRRRGVERRDDQ